MFNSDSEDLLTRNSYYEASATRNDSYPPLQTDIACDVCVVGAGLAGLSAAIDLADAGLTVAVLEAQRVGWGASGRNGGQALVGLACDMQVVERQLGHDAARQIWDTTVEAVQLIRQRCQRFGIDCEWQDGFLAAAVTERRAGELAQSVQALARDYGYDRMHLVDRAELPQWIASSRYRGAAFDSGSGHLHPLKYTLGLARAAAGLGVKIFEQSRAVEVQPGRQAVVRTPQGRVRCSHVLLAGNVYLADLAPRLATRIMPVGTFIAASRPLGAERAAQLLPRGAAVSDTQWVLDYFRLSRDHRMIFGGRVSYSTIPPRRLPEAMRRQDGGRISAARRRSDRIRLGRLCRHHDEPRARFRARGRQRLLPARVLGPWPRADGAGRPPGGRGDPRHGVPLRPVRPDQAPAVSGRTVVPHAAAGAGDGVVPAARFDRDLIE